MGAEIVKSEEASAALARAEDFGVSIETIIARVDKIRQVQARVMKEGLHYGRIPGVDKPSLLKPGAEILCLTFQLDPQFELRETRDGDHLEVVATCTLYHSPTGARLGSGVGSCSTRESKYAYRHAQRVCPSCGKAAIIKGKEEYGGGWLCFKKKDGCNAKFKDGDQAIEGQEAGRVANPDIADQYNTVRKMACKRAHVAASLFVTGGSELFTQDVEDMPRAEPAGNGARPANGNAGRQQQRPAPDVNEILERLRRAQSTTEIDEIKASLRGVRFPAAQSKVLSECARQRQEQLEDPDYRDPGDVDDHDADHGHDELGAAL